VSAKALGQPSAGEVSILLDRPEEPRQVGAAELVEADPQRAAELGVDDLRVACRARGRERGGLLGQRPEVNSLAVGAHVRVARPPELERAGMLRLDQLLIVGPKVLTGGREHRAFDLGAPLGVGFVGLRHRRLAKAEPLAPDLDRQPCLDACQGFLDGFGRLSDVALDREVEQHPRLPSRIAVAGRPVVKFAQRVHRIAGEQLAGPGVDRLDLERVLEPRVVLVVLAHQLGLEGLGCAPVRVEIHADAMLEAWTPHLPPSDPVRETATSSS
jgi:hypothetical protein